MANKQGARSQLQMGKSMDKCRQLIASLDQEVGRRKKAYESFKEREGELSQRTGELGTQINKLTYSNGQLQCEVERLNEVLRLKLEELERYKQLY